MSRIIFLNRFFYPDYSASSQILSDLAFHLAATGREIHVVTSQQTYDDPATRLPSNEIVQAVRIHRVTTTRFGRSNLIGRSLDYLSFYWSMWRWLAGCAQRGDILVAKTDPPLLSVLAAHAAKRRSMHLINWLQDIYPEIAIELGVPFFRGPIGGAIAFLRNWSLRLADANVVPGESMAIRVQTSGIASDHIHVIPNWTNDEEITPVPPAQNMLRKHWKLEHKFVVGYSGNLGRAHEFETVLAAAERLRGDSRVVFVFVGGGKQFNELNHRVHAQRLEGTVRFFPYQDRQQLRFSLSVPDVHWISLKPALEGLIFPSKFYGIAAAGRPMIAITAPDGEIGSLVRRYKCGFVIEPGDASGLSNAISLLAADASTCNQMGARARAMLDTQFTRQQAFAHWQRLLATI